MSLKKITALACIALGLASVQTIKADETICFDNGTYGDVVFDGIFNKVSNNGKWAVGNGISFSPHAFYFDLETRELTCISNPYCLELEADGDDKYIHFMTTAYDCSDNGIIVGTYVFPDNTGKYPVRQSVPAYYVISEKKWYKLDDKSGSTMVESSLGNNMYGEATSISKDGKFISGWILNKVVNQAGGKTVQLGVPCMWQLNETTKEYEMIVPLTTEGIATQGDRVFNMSDNGERLAGVSCHISGIWAAGVWDKEYNRTRLIQDELIPAEGHDPLNGEIHWADDQDMGVGATTTGVSSDGRYVTCVATHDTFGPTKGFRYDCETEKLEELDGIPCCITAKGTPVIMSIGMGGYSSIDDSNTILAGSTIQSIGEGGMVNVPVIKILSEPYKEGAIIDPEVDVNYVENLDVDVFINGKQLTVGGEFTSLQVMNVTGVILKNFDNTNSTVDLSYLPTGVYFVRIVNGEKFTSKPIVIK